MLPLGIREPPPEPFLVKRHKFAVCQQVMSARCLCGPVSGRVHALGVWLWQANDPRQEAYGFVDPVSVMRNRKGIGK